MFTRKAIADETHLRTSTVVCKSVNGIDTSQLFLYSMFQPMPTTLYARYDFDADLQKFNAPSD